LLSLFIRNIFDAKVRDYWQISKCTVNIIVRATQTVVAREAIIALCTGNKKTVRATRVDEQMTVRAARADKEKTNKRRTKDEQRTNKERTKDGASRTGR